MLARVADRESAVIRVRAFLIFLSTLACFTTAARAEIVSNLYEAEVSVASRSEADLGRASREGLAQVLVKVTGSPEHLDNPALSEALASARSLVQQYAYLDMPGLDGGLGLRLQFESEQINGLVTRAGAPLWTANRPSVLVWLIIEDSTGRQFLDGELQPELAAELSAAFDHRGVPSQLPLHDLTDSAALASSEAWRLYEPALLGASNRYGVSEVLAGRVASLSTGAWVGDWSYFADGQRLDRSVTADSPSEFLGIGVALVADDMASRYAVAATAAPAGGVQMLVEGVENYADYAKLVAWLEGLELVEHANVEQIQGGQLLLRVHARVDGQQLAALLELNDRLRPLERPLETVDLAYQWQN